MAKNKLGRGMDNLFDDNSLDTSNRINFIQLDSISPKKDQPRKHFDGDLLSELASSIAAHGVIQPLIVREQIGGAGYEIIAGERRYRASKLAGLSEVPCIVMEADELAAAELALIENIQREDLNPYEEAKAFRALIDDFGLSQEEMAKKVGKSRPAIANSLRLLDLPDSIAELVAGGKMSAGHARALLSLRDKSAAEELAERIVKRGLSVRETEAAVRRHNKESEESERARGEEVGDDDNLRLGVHVDYYEELERRVMGLTGRKIRISSGRGRNTVRIEYAGTEDLEELLARICGESIVEKE